MLNLKPMHCAIEQAISAESKDEVPVGAIIVNTLTGEIIAKAHNEMRERKDPTAHAELLAIRQACLSQGESRLTECDIYVTLEPCPMCAQAISFARFKRLYFGAYDPKGGGIDHGPRIFNSTSCHHVPEIIGGFEEKKCADLLLNFFEKKRVT